MTQSVRRNTKTITYHSLLRHAPSSLSSSQSEQAEITTMPSKDIVVKQQPQQQQPDPLLGIMPSHRMDESIKSCLSSSNPAAATTERRQEEDRPLFFKKTQRAPSPSYSSSTTTAESTTLQDQLQAALHHEAWDTVERLLEEHPCLAREPITMICQGENSTCLPIHYASGQKSTPVSTIDALVTAHPSSLLATESSGLRLPLHICILKHASFAVVRYMCEALPQSMGIKDQEGNLPLHYAAMYSNDAIVSLLTKSYPQACHVVNQSDRLPLHLLCARCWDHDAISVSTIETVLEHNPAALEAKDRRGRLPIHVCCSSQNPRADVLQVLVPAHAESLLETDKSKQTPLDLARKFASDGVVLAFLQERTTKERRKKYKFLAPFKNVGGKLARRRHAHNHGKADIDALKQLHYCYG